MVCSGVIDSKANKVLTMYYLHSKRNVAFASPRSQRNKFRFHCPVSSEIVRRVACSSMPAIISEAPRHWISKAACHYSQFIKRIIWSPTFLHLIDFRALFTFTVIKEGSTTNAQHQEASLLKRDQLESQCQNGSYLNLLLRDTLRKYVEVTHIEGIELRGLHIKLLKVKPNIQRRIVLHSIKIQSYSSSTISVEYLKKNYTGQSYWNGGSITVEECNLVLDIRNSSYLD